MTIVFQKLFHHRHQWTTVLQKLLHYRHQLTTVLQKLIHYRQCLEDICIVIWTTWLGNTPGLWIEVALQRQECRVEAQAECNMALQVRTLRALECLSGVRKFHSALQKLFVV